MAFILSLFVLLVPQEGCAFIHIISFEPQRKKMPFLTYAPNDVTFQPEQPRSLVKVFVAAKGYPKCAH